MPRIEKISIDCAKKKKSAVTLTAQVSQIPKNHVTGKLFLVFLNQLITRDFIAGTKCYLDLVSSTLDVLVSASEKLLFFLLMCS